MKKTIILFLSLLTYIPVCAQSYTLSYLYGGTTVTYSNYLEKTKNILNCVSPDYFVVSQEGNLEITKVDARFIDSMHAQGIGVNPFLSNNWDKPSGIAAMDNRVNLAQQVADAVNINNLDGVDVDIQNVSNLYKDSYTDLVRLLREKMPDKIISVAVAANPNGWTLGWHGSYDYKKLAEYCDYLMIMAYDESYYASEPGPVASKSFVENSIKYALKYTTPDKIILGMPFYGRYWKNGSGGNALTAKDIENILINYQTVKTYDENTQTAKVIATIKEDDIKPILWGGRTLGAGVYEIYYDDLQALEYKMDLAKAYNLKGTGSWALGQENTDIWALYEKKSGTGNTGENETEIIEDLIPNPEPEEKNPFSDIKNHWAYERILVINDNSWMSGNPDKTFLPENNLTRAESAEIIMNIADLPEISGWESYSFTDTKIHWASKSIALCKYYSFINGRDNNLYQPDEFITREEFSAIIDRVFNLATSVDYTNSVFTDVDNTRWSYNSIMILSENNIITGYDNGSFMPQKFITRAEAATILSKLIGYGINTPQTRLERKLQLPR